VTKKLLKTKINSRLRTQRKIRSFVSGTAQRPRLSVFKSNRFFYVQAIDDASGITLATFDGAKEKISSTREGAVRSAQKFAQLLKDKNVKEVVYDRNGYLYHGVVRAFAEELRNQSIKV